MIPTAKYFLGFLLWNLVIGLALFNPVGLPPLLGIALALAFTYWVLFRFVLRRGRPGEPRRWAALRLRPLRGEVLRWTAWGVPVLLLLNWAVNDLYFRLVPVPPDKLDPMAPYRALLETPQGQLTLALLAVGVAPLMEEFFFRGLMLRSLERRVGAGGALLLTSALFAAVHGFVWFFPLYALLGLAFGFAVYATRSIWAGVVLHAANNAAALLGQAVAGEEPPAPPPALWEGGPTAEGWVALGGLLLALAAAGWVARGMWGAGRGA